MAEIENHLSEARKRRRTDKNEESPANGHNAIAERSDTLGKSQGDSVLGRNDVEKRFECTHAGCGKSYSRAEHLHRHQLNRRWFRTNRLGNWLTCVRCSQTDLPMRFSGMFS